jgi:hypothetical protein
LHILFIQMKVGRPQGGPNGTPLASTNINSAAMQAAGLAAAAAGHGHGGSSVPAPPPIPRAPAAPAAVPHVLTAADFTMTIVLLDDMVPLAEASDPGLKGEIEEEASTHGALKDIGIQVIDNKFVRIKLHYVDASSAMKAYKAMNGRYFGGNVVKASLM